MNVWTKTSYSANGSHCVEVAASGVDAVENKATSADTAFVVRDSKNPDREPLVYTREEWDAFIAGVKDGEFDADVLMQKATVSA